MTTSSESENLKEFERLLNAENDHKLGKISYYQYCKEYDNYLKTANGVYREKLQEIRWEDSYRWTPHGILGPIKSVKFDIK